jgi:hypothetical protein
LTVFSKGNTAINAVVDDTNYTKNHKPERRTI